MFARSKKLTSSLLTFLLLFQLVAGVFLPFDFSLKLPYMEPREASAAEWYNSGYQYRREITINASQITADQVNFPVLATTTLADLKNNEHGGKVQNDSGYDVVFTDSDGNTLLNYEREKYASTTGEIAYWIKTDISSTTDKTIYMYYGKSGASDLATTTGVWDDNFVMVQHMQEDPGPGGAGDIKDSTKNANDGTAEATMTTSDQVAGQIDGSLDFDGGDYVVTGESADFDISGTQPISISAWVKSSITNPVGNINIIGVTEIGDGSGVWDKTLKISGETGEKGKFGFHVWDGSAVQCALSNNINDGNLHHLAAIYDGTNLLLYLDGISQVADTSTATYNFTTPQILVGGHVGSAPYFNGTIDEARISNTARSAGWIATEYNNQSAVEDFLTFGAEVANNIAPTATAPTATQATDGTGYVTIQTVIDDADGDDTVRFKVEYSLDSGSTWTNGDPHLITSFITTNPDQATEPAVTNSETYQVGMPTNNIITSAGANTVTIKWDTKSASNGTGEIGTSTPATTVKLRITPYDGTTVGTAVESAVVFTVDNTAPANGSIQINSDQTYASSSTATLTLSATNADQMKFSNNGSTYSTYEKYNTTKSWDIIDADYGGTSGDGEKSVYVIYIDSLGNEAAAVNDNIIYDTTPPTNPTSAIDSQSAVNDSWQNSKNDPNFTSFTGEFDINGIEKFYVYFGTSTAGTTTNSTTTDAYNPILFTTTNTRYLRVIAKDSAGLWADFDGAGTACSNINADRPADPDCWKTIFIHKYDINNPETPSPTSFPASWTNTNDFDFSWSDPGDVGAGVQDYTYETDAGTVSATTSNTSINSLTSDSSGTKLFSIFANDGAGNSGNTGTVNFHYDNIAPTNAGIATDGNGSLDDIWGTNSDPSFNWAVGSDAHSGVKEYDIYWGTSSTGETISITTTTNAYDPDAIPANTPYYLRIRTRDNVLNTSDWETKFTMKYSQSANSPSGLSQTANLENLILGGWTNDTTPTLNFTLSDPDSDALGYVIKIDDTDDFLSLITHYNYSADDLTSGEEHSFTIGQAVGTGNSYTVGTAGQTLSEGTYYWKIQAIENHGLASSEITANGGAVAFGVDGTDPTGTVLSFGTIAANAITAQVSGATDALSGLDASPYYFENTATATSSGWQAGTSWNSGSLSPNVQYTFKITSRDQAGNTQETATQNQYTLANVPTAPTVDNAATSSLAVNVNANENPAITEFVVYKETGADCDGTGGSYLAANGSDNGNTPVWQTDASWGTTTAGGLLENTQYSFCVKARNNNNTETAFSSSANGTTGLSVPTDPSGAVLSEIAVSSMKLTWTDNSSNEAEFKIEKSTDGTIYSQIGTVSADIEEYTGAGMSPLNPNTRYWFRVKASNAGGDSGYSTALAKYTLANVPSSLSLTADSATQITASWNANSNSTGTEYYCLNTTASTTSGWQTGVSWISSGLTCATSYSFKVKAKNKDGTETVFTDAVSATTNNCPAEETSGGGGLPPVASNPPSIPEPTLENPKGEFSVLINSGDEWTNRKTVNLKLIAGDDTTKMAISSNPEFTGASQIAFQENIEWELNKNIPNSLFLIHNSKYTVYAKFYTKYGVASEVVSDSIIFGIEDIEKDIDILDVEDIEEKDTDILDIEDTKDTKKDIKDIGILDVEDTEDTSWFHSPDRAVEPKMQDSEIQRPIEPDEPGIVDKITDKIIDIFKPELKPKAKIPIKELVVRETPASMKGEWNLLPQKQINKFVLAPLPQGLERLAQKFSDLRKTFNEVGINKITDLEKLRNTSLSLPGLTKSLGLEEKDLELVKNLPISEFSQEIKNRIPTEIIFAQISGEKNIKNIDFNIKLSINEKGETRQKIRAISGKKLFLTIKPESKADSVTGYVSFINKNQELGIKNQEETLISNFQFSIFQPKADQPLAGNQFPITKFSMNKSRIRNLVNSFVFAKPAFAEDYDSEIEEKFVTQKFAYADEDGDGIWTAEIYAPIVEGEYEIMTIIEYEDPKMGTRMVKLTTVVDPEGYVYERVENQELRITNAVVSIYKLNSENSEYELWQADNYNQKNPQTTDKTGRYSFLVPEGTYYITAESRNHSSYKSEPFTIQEGGGVHQNIELKAKNAWLKAFDWKVLAIFLLFVLVVWNFWKDKIRNMKHET